MSRPRSSPPQSRRPPWNDRGSYKGFAGYSKSRSDWSPTLRDEDHRFREGMIPEGQRRASPSPQDPIWRHQDDDGYYRGRPSPRRDAMDRRVPRSSTQRDGGSDADRQRREDMHFSNRGWAPCSPSRFPMDHQAPNSHSDHSKGAPDWRREQWGQGGGRFRGVSPTVRSDEQRGGRREKNAEGPHRSRPREDLHQEMSPPWKRARREMEPQHHSGFRRENKVFGEQRSSPAFEGDHRGGPPHKDAHGSGALAFDHDHYNQDSWKPPQQEHLDHGDHVFNQQRESGPRSSSQEGFRTSNNKPDVREDSRRRSFAENWRGDYESRRSPPPQERANVPRFARRHGPANLRGRCGPHSARERFDHNHVRNVGPPKYRPNFHHFSRGYHGNARKDQRVGFIPQEEAQYSNAMEEDEDEEEEQSWTEGDGHLEQIRPASLKQHLARDNPGKEQNWPFDGLEDKKSKNMTVVTEETLTIKVDMSRPAHASTLCYSADRQLSLDLVNVGRQRLDFLPSMTEPSRSKQDGTVHTGTFAQEIITLVHHVKELYFKGEGITLNKRFSAPQKGHCEEEGAGMTLDQRFSSNNFNSNMSAKPQDDLFPHQPMHGPGDLRHDLERRRQQRLDGVTITIPGSSQRGALSTVKFGGDDVTIPEVQDHRWDANTSSRRGGAPSRMNVGPPQRYRNRQPMGGQNHNNNTGPSW
ncbi:BCLAF1 and THRAP3 family member 3 [Dunckerocampus dactyliophorus]|uniref:BCLAF1 and THRAP3 family member 3 n=1 Tax=Dunckerocampus dactyliophorus TaxID=161453 RepID=UPI002407387A|nr:BCLAF1 and THRAP3 family member 3 [Dunckerocampus dactyliophorus]